MLSVNRNAKIQFSFFYLVSMSRMAVDYDLVYNSRDLQVSDFLPTINFVTLENMRFSYLVP